MVWKRQRSHPSCDSKQTQLARCWLAAWLPGLMGSGFAKTMCFAKHLMILLFSLKDFERQGIRTCNKYASICFVGLAVDALEVCTSNASQLISFWLRVLRACSCLAFSAKLAAKSTNSFMSILCCSLSKLKVAKILNLKLILEKDPI